jgi:hypothetical protein
VPGVVVDGIEKEIPGLVCRHWKEVPSYALKAVEDYRARRTKWVRAIVLHTTLGKPDVKQIEPGQGPHTRAAQRIGKWWSKDGRRAGCHLMCDLDGSWANMADLATATTFHAGAVNDNTIGIEIYQDGEDGVLFDQQLQSVVLMCDYLTRVFGIQRQVHFPFVGPIQRLRNGGDDCVGIYGHRDVTSTRSRGDPGDAVFERLVEGGYEPWDYDAEEDLSAWKLRQHHLNEMFDAKLVVDGVAGPGTVSALRVLTGRPYGLHVTRPGD